ncbi:tetratricopeptide repeat protein [Hyphococcus luteus]|nr:tetratricopeptide repeat protein [Marinicaulis flavus]
MERLPVITIAACAAALSGCAGVDCMSVPSYRIGNIQYYEEIDSSGCAAYQAERETYAYGKERAERQARNGSSYDKYSLGEKYETGGTVSIKDVDTGAWRGESVALQKSRRQAIYWYKEAVKQGGSGAGKAREALIRLGKTPPETPAETLATQGYDAHKRGDDAQAARLWRQAAEKGNAAAQYNLGWAYENGRGVEQNGVEAARWYRQAAEQGHSSAQYSLGVMRLAGRAVSQDSGEAARLFRLAAEQGHASAQKNLGLMYKNGDGVGQNDVAAVQWFRRAAEQDHGSAQFSLGLMYEEGRGVERNLDQAARWYRKAAASGNEDAQRALALLRASVFRPE